MSITVVMWFKKKRFLIEKSCWLPSNAVSDRMAFLIVWSWNISCFFILCLCPCFACFFFYLNINIMMVLTCKSASAHTTGVSPPAICPPRHPLQELCCSPFIPNDMLSGGTHSKVKILTGPNACGKSVYLKQVCKFLFWTVHCYWA